MEKDAILKIRCEADLKARLTRLAQSRRKDLSEYVRERLWEVIEAADQLSEGAIAEGKKKKKGR